MSGVSRWLTNARKANVLQRCGRTEGCPEGESGHEEGVKVRYFCNGGMSCSQVATDTPEGSEQ